MLDAKKLFCLSALAAFVLTGSPATARMSARQIYKTKAPGVVLIVASQEGSSSASAGTGSIISADGTVITNCHVIYDESAKAPYPAIHIFLKPDKLTGDMNKDLSRHFTGEVVAFDKALDLALLKIKNAPAGLTVLTLGDPGELGPGDETIAIGHPEQGGLWTITRGVIGAEFENFKGVSGKDVFQMDTSLNRGNSGGPLFDVRGYQVAVNTAIARKGAGGVAITGVNFAIKASVVKDWAAKHAVRLAYGSEPLKGDERVAVADSSPAQPAPGPATPAPEVHQPAAGSDRTYKDPSGKGSIRVEEGYGSDDEGEEYIPDRAAPDTTDVRRHPPKVRRPIRFHKLYRMPPHPYTYRKLFTEVDKVRARAQGAFDDLDAEIHKHGK